VKKDPSKTLVCQQI